MATRDRSLLLLLAVASSPFLLPQSSVSGADPKGRPKRLLINSIGMKLVPIPEGEFRTGSPGMVEDIHRRIDGPSCGLAEDRLGGRYESEVR